MLAPAQIIIMLLATMTCIEIDIGLRMATLRMLYFVTFTYILNVIISEAIRVSVKKASCDFYRYSPTIGIHTNVLLGDVDLNFQNQTIKR